MPFAFFSIPAAARPDVAAELNAFLRSHRVLRVTQQGAATPSGRTTRPPSSHLCSTPS